MSRIDLERVPRRHGVVARVAGWLLTVGLRLFMRLPGPVVLVLLWVAVLLARRVAGEQAAEQVADVRAVFAGDPRGSVALRRLVLGARTGQLVAFLQGMLRHHLFAAPEERLLVAGPRIGSSRPVRGTLRVAVVGGGHEAARLAAAYREQGEVVVSEEITEEVHAVEVVGMGPMPMEHLAEALERGVSVSVHHAALPSAGALEGLRSLAEASGAFLRVLHPALYYPPVHRLRELVVAGELGEVGTIRVRATLGGSGGRAPPCPPDPDAWLTHPAFDHTALLVILGGPARQVCSYLTAMSPLGGQGVIACRFAHPGRYGVLECAHAPGLVLPSEHHPWDLEVEVSGSDGIAWLRRGMARRTWSAPLDVRVGRKAYSLGVESGLPARWARVYDLAAQELVQAMRGGVRPAVSPADLLEAARLRDGAIVAATHPGVLEVNPMLRRSAP